MNIERELCKSCTDFACVKACFQEALALCGYWRSVEEVMQILRRDSCFWGEDGGVTLGGGDPLFQADFHFFDETFRNIVVNIELGIAETHQTLVLNGLPSLSTEAAAALAEFPGELVLKAITELPPDAAAALAKHKGRLHLTGLTAISPETRAALQGHANLLLPRQVPSGP